jgi:hypothetical protein
VAEHQKNRASAASISEDCLNVIKHSLTPGCSILLGQLVGTTVNLSTFLWLSAMKKRSEVSATLQFYHGTTENK